MAWLFRNIPDVADWLFIAENNLVEKFVMETL